VSYIVHVMVMVTRIKLFEFRRKISGNIKHGKFSSENSKNSAVSVYTFGQRFDECNARVEMGTY